MRDKHAMPDNCLDDRLGIVGTSGAGKTFAAKGLVERLLKSGARVCMPDALGVWWGLRSSANGKKAGYPVTVFGGKHADVDINENHGAALARLIASTNISTVLDVSEFPSMAARRRFMTAFTETIYEHNRKPLHLVFDEADLWAPQRPQDGCETLLNRMDEIVRRGRVRGFIPWLITQRPAVVHKDVLSQVDVLIAMKLTSSQDRDALQGWIEGQADKGQWKEIRTSLPALPRGDGYIWAPTHKILERVTFPMIETFDSSRTPKRGEKIAGPTKLASVDLSAIKDQLASIKTEMDADDPAILRKEITKLKKELAAKPSAAAASDPDKIMAARRTGFEQAEADAKVCVKRMHKDFCAILDDLQKRVKAIATGRMNTAADDIYALLNNFPQPPAIPALIANPWKKGTPLAEIAEKEAVRRSAPVQEPRPPRKTVDESSDEISAPIRKIIDALAWWAAANISKPTKFQVSVLAAQSLKSSSFKVYCRQARAMGLIDFDKSTFSLTAEGSATANEPDETPTTKSIQKKVADALGGTPAMIVEAAIDAYPGTISADDIANTVGNSLKSSSFKVYLRKTVAMGAIEKSSGEYKAAKWLFI